MSQRRKQNRSGLFSAVAAGALVLSGCGNYHEQHLFQTQAPDGTVSYYRVRVTGTARTAETHVRAGLFDLRAVDAILDENEQPISDVVYRTKTEADRFRLYNEKLTAAWKDYLEAAEDPKRSAESEYKTLEQILDAPDILDSRKKYVVIFSAMSSSVVAAFAEWVEGEQFGQTIASVGAAFGERDAAEAIESRDRAVSERAPLTAAVESVRTLKQTLAASDGLAKADATDAEKAAARVTVSQILARLTQIAPGEKDGAR
ncbi:MAG: hypothetical protein AAF108_02110 [Planctomycetota bacterium]